MDIEKGMHIRTKHGEIHKVDKVNSNAVYCNDWKNIFDSIHEITNASNNVIDLVEYMDLIYINKPIKVFNHRGEEHIIGFFNPLRCDGWSGESIILNMDWLAKKEDIKNEDINLVITNQQIIKYSFKAGE
jgi:hypothetical protein